MRGASKYTWRKKETGDKIDDDFGAYAGADLNRRLMDFSEPGPSGVNAISSATVLFDPTGGFTIIVDADNAVNTLGRIKKLVAERGAGSFGGVKEKLKKAIGAKTGDAANTSNAVPESKSLKAPKIGAIIHGLKGPTGPVGTN